VWSYLQIWIPPYIPAGANDRIDGSTEVFESVELEKLNLSVDSEVGIRVSLVDAGIGGRGE
jgi:hypothetical protein